MAESILPKLSYTVHFTAEEMKNHRQLLLVGSVLSQLLEEIRALATSSSASYSLAQGLKQCLYWIDQGHALAQQWCQLVESLQSVYDAPSNIIREDS